MLKVTIPSIEYFDEEKQEFVKPVEKPVTLKLEHSLISIQKWESKWQKAFLTDKSKSKEETLHYIECMSISDIENPKILEYLPQEELARIGEYIEAPMTATWFGDDVLNNKRYLTPKREVVTAELIYYWMISLNIPSEYKKWHLNQLITLIKVINTKNEQGNGKKRRSRKDILSRYDQLNAQRRAALNTKG